MSGHDGAAPTDCSTAGDASIAELLLLLGADSCVQISHPIYSNPDYDLATNETYTNDVALSPESGFASDSAATIPSPDHVHLYELEPSARPYLKIIEEPEELFRFRYLKEAKVPHGPICGCKSGSSRGTSRKKTDSGPKIKLFNFTGEAVIRCWLTLPGTREPHVHQLVVTGKPVSDQTREPHVLTVNALNHNTASYDKLNIIHAVTENLDDQKDYWRRKNLIAADFSATVENITKPFKGDKIRKEIKNAEKNLASLSFEAFSLTNGEYKRICEPVTSRAIRNTKNPKWNVLKIHKYLPCQGSCEGNDEAILLVDKIVKDVKIRFFELNDKGEEVWTTEVVPDEVHKQVAIVFRTPSYRSIDLDRPVVVQFKIVRNEDESQPKKFIFTPSITKFNPGKKRCFDATVSDELLENLRAEVKENPVNFECFPSAESCSYRSLSEIDMVLQNEPTHQVERICPRAQEKSIGFDHFLETDGDKSPSMPDLIEKVPKRKEIDALSRQPLSQRPTSTLGRSGPIGDSVNSTRSLSHTRGTSYQNIPLAQRILLNDEIHRWNSLSTGIDDSVESFNSAGETALLRAIKVNDVDAMENLLRLHPHFIQQRTLTGDDGPFHVAVKNRRFEIIQTLIKMKYRWNQVNGANLTPLHYAVRQGNENIVRALLSPSYVDIRPKIKMGSEQMDFSDDEEYSSDEDEEMSFPAAQGLEILKGPPLNQFIPNKKIFDLLLSLSNPQKVKTHVTTDDLQPGGSPHYEKLCSKLARALNLQFLGLVSSKQPYKIIENFLEAKVGPEEARVKIERALSELSIEE